MPESLLAKSSFTSCFFSRQRLAGCPGVPEGGGGGGVQSSAELAESSDVDRISPQLLVLPPPAAGCKAALTAAAGAPQESPPRPVAHTHESPAVRAVRAQLRNAHTRESPSPSLRRCGGGRIGDWCGERAFLNVDVERVATTAGPGACLHSQQPCILMIECAAPSDPDSR